MIKFFFFVFSFFVIGLMDCIELIQIFVCIVEVGSLLVVVVQLVIMQFIVSCCLQVLECLLGVCLLQCFIYVMKMIEDGECCYECVKELLVGWDEFESELCGVCQYVEGMLWVVVLYVFGQKQLIVFLLQFMQCYLCIIVEWLLYDCVVDFISQGIDCVIQVGEVNDFLVVVIYLVEVLCMMVVVFVLLEGWVLLCQLEELVDFLWIVILVFYCCEIMFIYVISGEQCQVVFCLQLVIDSLYVLCNIVIEGMGVVVGLLWVLVEDVVVGCLV